MNTNKFCDRFEREGILRIERGLSLDTHFDTCPTCDVARHKYETLLGALPSAQPDVLTPLNWQARVLRSVAENDSARQGISMPGWGRSFAWTAMAGAGALAAVAFLGGPQPIEFEVQAETHVVASVPEPPVEDTIEDITGEPEVTTAEPLPPPPVAPKPLPRQTAPMAQPPVQTPEAVAPQALVPAKPAPNTPTKLGNSEPMANATAQRPPTRTTPRVTRPDKLYGLAIKYPPQAMRAKIQGETSVQCTIRSDGRNTNCHILKSLPYIDNAVIRAVEAARSEPIRVNGKPVDHSDHIWNITITLREIVDDRTSARGLPVLNWDH